MDSIIIILLPCLIIWIVMAFLPLEGLWGLLYVPIWFGFLWSILIIWRKLHWESELSRRVKKQILGWIIVAIYTLMPWLHAEYFGHPNSNIEAWDWLNFIYVILFWELLIRDWLFE